MKMRFISLSLLLGFLLALREKDDFVAHHSVVECLYVTSRNTYNREHVKLSSGRLLNLTVERGGRHERVRIVKHEAGYQFLPSSISEQLGWVKMDSMYCSTSTMSMTRYLRKLRNSTNILNPFYRSTIDFSHPSQLDAE